MIYSQVTNQNISKLGFGAMRLPLLEDKSIDQKQVEQMIDYAIENGVNYFDTAWPYHAGMSEIVISKFLSKYPRDKYFLADKYPGHQIAEKYDPKDIFEKQLKKNVMLNILIIIFYIIFMKTILMSMKIASGLSLIILLNKEN